MSVQHRAPTTWEHQDSDPKAALALAFGAPSFIARPDGAPMTTADRVRVVRTLAIATEYAVENARVVGVPPTSDKDRTTKLGAELRGDLFATRAHCYAASTIARLPFACELAEHLHLLDDPFTELAVTHGAIDVPREAPGCGVTYTH